MYYYPWEVFIVIKDGTREAYLKSDEDRKVEYQKRGMKFIETNRDHNVEARKNI